MKMTGFSSAACSASQSSFGYLPANLTPLYSSTHSPFPFCNLASLPAKHHFPSVPLQPSDQRKKENRAQRYSQVDRDPRPAAFRLSCVTAAINDPPNACDHGYTTATYPSNLTILPTTSEKRGCATTTETRFAFIPALFACILYTRAFCFFPICIYLVGAERAWNRKILCYSPCKRFAHCSRQVFNRDRPLTRL
ncbi:uncharacterized protein B0J16DRAFT_95406 [Fusarium flagelliforme]|uniref:uncharacterized protein n=1 Tax=Fusarium flagelliforme TaxID=2675880 RepID=UPI001E8DDF6B|nr:uncharacterized protein B0J16DRAFT_95406 [Fusarium flagelliforme]KAH7188511.1 hypothetical protein B0J16DRAFT_95406 [Fusarium flagelliforme]